jgi:tetraacyldisaccharide 4'-kinase
MFFFSKSLQHGVLLNNSSLFFTIGRPFSPLYSWLMTTRATLYKKDILKRYTLPVPVISIGNLTMGGSGKTPVIMALAQWLKDRGYRPAVISRGYGGKAAEKFNIVTTGEKVLLSPEEAGDEPFMLANSLKGIPVITGKSRIHPCRYAANTLHADIILLDDGFQHMAINRTIDMVLFNATTLAGNSRVFPGGVLREPVNALSRCHAFMLTGVAESNRSRAENFAALLKKRFPDKPLFFANFTQGKIASVTGGEKVINSSDLDRAYGFCAIANPVRFQEAIEASGVDLIHFKSFRDHKKYCQRSMDTLCSEAAALGAGCLITTTKDFVKISSLKRTLPLYVLNMKLELDRTFKEYIMKKLE